MLDIRPTRAQVSGRFAWLMGLYADNYWRLVRGLGPDNLGVGHYRSSVGDGLDLSIEVVERHPYTLDLRLSYLFRDAQLAEVTACYVGARLQDVLGLHPEPRSVMQHRLRMNAFLGKWLEYLEGRGHSRFTVRAAATGEAMQEKVDASAPHP